MFLSLVPVEDCLHFAVEYFQEMVLKGFDVLQDLAIVLFSINIHGDEATKRQQILLLVYISVKTNHE